MKAAKIILVFYFTIVAVEFLIFGNSLSQNLIPSSTGKYFFVCTQSGKVLWKHPVPESVIQGYAWNDSFLVIKYWKSIEVFGMKSGKFLCKKGFLNLVKGVGVSNDTLIVSSPTHMIFLSAKDCGLLYRKKLKRKDYFGQLLSKFNFKSIEKRRDRVYFVNTSKYLLAFSPDAKLVWRHPISGYRFLGDFQDLLFISSKDSVKVMDKNSGKNIWERAYSQKIESVVIGRRTEVHLENGDAYIYKSKTGELLKKKLQQE